MSQKLVTIRIKNLVVESNGNFDDEHFAHDDEQGLKNNSLMASLKYPRSGAPNVVAVKQFDLGNNDPARLIDADHPDEFFDPLLFREEVTDYTVLHLGVTKLDAEGKATKIFLSLLSVLLKAGFGVATGGLGAVLGAVAGFGVDGITGEITKAGDNNDTLIGAADIPIKTDDYSGVSKEIEIKFKVPKDVVRRRLVLDAHNHPVPEDVTLLKKDQQNGSITLLVSAVPA